MNTRLLVSLLPLLSLGACASPHVDPIVETSGMPSAELALSRSMDRVRSELDTLGTMQLPDGVAMPSATSTTSGELEAPIYFSWNGPLDAGAKRLGALVGYHVQIFPGSPSAPPVFIRFTMSGAAGDVIRAFGAQAGQAASVTVDAMHQQIAVVHHA